MATRLGGPMAATALVAALVAPGGAAWASTPAVTVSPTLLSPPSGGPIAGDPVTRVIGATIGTLAPFAPDSVSAAPAAPAQAASSSPQITVSPDSNLINGQSVTVTTSGMSANSYGGLIECNLANDEPTVSVEGNNVPVGCTNPLSTLKTTDASGGFTTSFTVHTGTIGPPAQGTDSSGGAASADAAKYPCPPTPAQQAAGTTCGIAYGDTAGDQATAPVTFAAITSSPGSSGGAGTSPRTSSDASPGVPGASGSASVAAAGAAPATSAGGGSSGGGLALTGAGPGFLPTVESGLLMVVLGSLLTLWSARARRRAAGSLTGCPDLGRFLGLGPRRPDTRRRPAVSWPSARVPTRAPAGRPR